MRSIASRSNSHRSPFAYHRIVSCLRGQRSRCAAAVVVRPDELVEEARGPEHLVEQQSRRGGPSASRRGGRASRGRQDAVDLDQARAERGEVCVEREAVVPGEVGHDLVAIGRGRRTRGGLRRRCPVRIDVSRWASPVANGGSA